MGLKARRPGVQKGYDLWSASYDETPNPLVWLDRKHIPSVLDPQRGDRILDAGCGTGAHISYMIERGARPVGIDFSAGMIGVARARYPRVDLAQADLNRHFPFKPSVFDVVISALVSEHIASIQEFCTEVFRVLKHNGTFVWSVFHPSLAQAGVEANFTHDGLEVRLGAELHTEEEYDAALQSGGLTVLEKRVFDGTAEMAARMERAVKYEGRPLLIIYRAVKR